jgi:WD40 repeat protein
MNIQAISVILYIKTLRALVVASLTGHIVLMDMDGVGYPVISSYSEHKHAVRALEFLPSFKYIVSAERDIRLWGTCSVV